MRRIAVFAVAVLAVLFVAAAVADASRGHNTGGVFRGNGGKTLTPFSVSVPSTLFWTDDGGVFQIFPSGGGLGGSVNSQASKGWTYLPRGRYLLQVNAIGNWTITIRAGIVPPLHGKGQLAKNGWRVYVGNGGMALPPFTVPHATTLYWTANGSIFQIFPGGLNGVLVNSQAHRGTTYMSAGVQQLQINTTGAWSLAWHI